MHIYEITFQSRVMLTGPCHIGCQWKQGAKKSLCCVADPGHRGLPRCCWVQLAPWCPAACESVVFTYENGCKKCWTPRCNIKRYICKQPLRMHTTNHFLTSLPWLCVLRAYLIFFKQEKCPSANSEYLLFLILLHRIKKEGTN